MERLTYHTDNGVYTGMPNSIPTRKALEKLSKLEDIEEELGTDLVTLVSALSSLYIYGITSDEDHEKPYIFVFDTRDAKLNAEEKTLDVYWQCSDEIYTQYKLSDYGKTWALTMEELE